MRKASETSHRKRMYVGTRYMKIEQPGEKKKKWDRELEAKRTVRAKAQGIRMLGWECSPVELENHDLGGRAVRRF